MSHHVTIGSQILAGQMLCVCALFLERHGFCFVWLAIRLMNQ